MRAKKILVIVLAAIFGLTVLFSFAFIFSVKRVKVDYLVSQTTDVTQIEMSLNQFVGKNLLFLDLEDVETEIKKYPYFKVDSIKKSYPNVIELNVTERREVYCITLDNYVYILDQTGFVLNKVAVAEFEGVGDNRIELDIQGVEGLTLTIGNKIQSQDMPFIDSVLQMASAVDLTDCIDKISIVNDNSFEYKGAFFYTHTGVKMEIRKPEVLGVEKITKVFEVYDDISDYLKAFDSLIGYSNDQGEIFVDWSSQSEGGQNV